MLVAKRCQQESFGVQVAALLTLPRSLELQQAFYEVLKLLMDFKTFKGLKMEKGAPLYPPRAINGEEMALI